MQTAKPVTLLAGGAYHRRNARDPLLADMLSATGVKRPTVAYVGVASGDDPGFFRLVSRLLEMAGAGSVALAPLAGAGADYGAARAVLDRADAIFVSGGDVEAGMRILAESGAADWLRQRYEEGAVLGGLSAGSILLARQWVRWRDPDDDATAEPFDCLGLAPLVCDMHGEADGWDELQTLLRLRGTPGELGYGVPTSRGLRVHPDGRVEAVGGAVTRYAWRNGRVDDIGDISPACCAHPTE